MHHDLERHRKYMQMALTLSMRGLGNTFPNPAVGCVVVKEGKVIGRGWTQPGGRPHAEVVALKQAGDAARDATVYVTLEPCSHYGKTPPCSKALIEAGVASVFVALGDPDDRVSGRGLTMLRDAGIAVHTGLMESEAYHLQRGFLYRVTENRPLVSAKIATTLDGKIATKTGESQWITGSKARQYGHMMRKNHDAILVGIGTALCDDPLLNCRISDDLPNHDHPVRVVLDQNARLPLTSKMVKSAPDIPVILLHSSMAAHQDVDALKCAGVTVIEIPQRDDLLDLQACLGALAHYGVTRLMVEGGGGVLTQFIRQDLVDDLYWFQSPCLIGEDGRPAVRSLSVESLQDAKRWRETDRRSLGGDLLKILRPV